MCPSVLSLQYLAVFHQTSKESLQYFVAPVNDTSHVWRTSLEILRSDSFTLPALVIRKQHPPHHNVLYIFSSKYEIIEANKETSGLDAMRERLMLLKMSWS